jgi:hypothetical protein
MGLMKTYMELHLLCKFELNSETRIEESEAKERDRERLIEYLLELLGDVNALKQTKLEGAN